MFPIPFVNAVWSRIKFTWGCTSWLTSGPGDSTVSKSSSTSGTSDAFSGLPSWDMLVNRGAEMMYMVGVRMEEDKS